MHASPRRALPFLLAQYLAGHIAEAQWQAFSSTYDAAGLDADSRAALASFYHDAVAEDVGVKMPTMGEVQDLLPMLRGQA